MFLKIIHIIKFILFYIMEIVIANIRVAYYILSPKLNMKTGVIAVPLDVTSDLEILSLNNLITMTPGSISLDVSTDRKVIYVHVMFSNDIESIRSSIKQGLETKLMEVSR